MPFWLKDCLSENRLWLKTGWTSSSVRFFLCLQRKSYFLNKWLKCISVCGINILVDNSANLDEQKLTGTADISINKEDGIWHITDYGRGLNYHHLTQNENDEKLSAEGLIGKFGVGLKDSLAVFFRHDIKVVIRSKYGTIRLKQLQKEGFDDITTLHAEISDPDDAEMVGTDFSLEGCADEDIEAAKRLFLCFSDEIVLESTGFGQILDKPLRKPASIYIHGIKVAEEPNFLFSYNITDLPNKLRKALNRERDNVGRAAYTDTVKNILESVETPDVLETLMHDLEEVVKGGGHDEMNWIDVQLYVIEQLSRLKEKILFITADEAVNRRMEVSDAQDDGYEVFVIPDKLKEKAKSLRTVTTIERYNQKKNNSFSGEEIDISELTAPERDVYDMLPEIVAFMGGLPGVISNVRITEEIYEDEEDKGQTVGLWDSKSRIIWIKRSQLRSLSAFAGTLIHECTHAATRYGDVSRNFETALTDNLGKMAAYYLR